MRQIYKRVCVPCASVQYTNAHTELDALGLDDEPLGEGETPSYLHDEHALPDFVDAAPVEPLEVRVAMAANKDRLMRTELGADGRSCALGYDIACDI